MEYEGNLVLIRGLPGSGKSTMARNLFPECEHYEADDYFTVFEKDAEGIYKSQYRFDPAKLGKAHFTCQEDTRVAMDEGSDVVVSNTFTTFKEMQPYIEMAKARNYRVFIIEATGTFDSVHNVPFETIKNMSRRWERIYQNKDGSWNSY